MKGRMTCGKADIQEGGTSRRVVGVQVRIEEEGGERKEIGKRREREKGKEEMRQGEVRL